jgi:alpha-galactosidase/6-phospho-beta-glucosidase family protein
LAASIGASKAAADLGIDHSLISAWKRSIISALHHGTGFSTHLNLANQGAIAGVDDDACCEIPCAILNRRIERRQVRFPARFTAEVVRIAREQSLLAQACDQFSEDLLVEALMLDALVPKDRDLIRRILRPMLDYQRQFIAA